MHTVTTCDVWFALALILIIPLDKEDFKSILRKKKNAFPTPIPLPEKQLQFPTDIALAVPT